MGRFREYHNGNPLGGDLCGTYFIRSGGKWVPNGTALYPKESGYRDIHACWDETHPGPPYRSGGAFSALSFDGYDIKRVSGPSFVNERTGSLRYEGGFYVQWPSLYFPFSIPKASFESDAKAGTGTSWGHVDPGSYGPTGWAKFKPGKPTATSLEFFAELGEAPKMLRDTGKFFSDSWRRAGGQSGLFGPKRIANDWLGANFGWFPFVNDLRKMYKTAVNMDAAIKRIKRENGRWTHRGGTISANTTTTKLMDNGNYISILPLTYGGYLATGSTPRTDVTQKVTKHAWFSGSFRYYIPNTDSWQWNALARAELFGALPTPTALYDLTPWSWLIDWYSNIGDNIANMSNGYADNLAAAYAYVMSTTIYTYTMNSSIKYNGGATINISSERNVSFKGREGASPFGFGLSGDLTPRQAALLVALGLQRSA